MKRLIFLIMLVAAAAVLFVQSASINADEGVSPGGDILYTKPVKSVVFSHRLHVEDKGLSCDMCHSGLFDASALRAQEKGDFTMESLYKGKYCGACHDGKTAFASNTQCARCHIGVKGFNAAQKGGNGPGMDLQGPKDAIAIGAGDSAVRFSHWSHTKSIKCDGCHSELFPMKRGKTTITMGAIYQGKFCGACHNGKRAFPVGDCAKCHKIMPAPKEDLVYKVKDLSPVRFSHQFHRNLFGCKDCHSKPFAMKQTPGRMNMDAINSGKYCGACHNGKKAFSAAECTKCHIDSKS